MTFYNAGEERVAVRSQTHNDDRYLRQEGETRPVLSMMPHPFPSDHRRLFYSNASVKNDTPYDVRWISIEYAWGSCEGQCRPDRNRFIGTGGTWTVQAERGICLITAIYVSLDIYDENKVGGYGSMDCRSYSSSGTGYSQFYIMLIDGECCTRSKAQDADTCE